MKRWAFLAMILLLTACASNRPVLRTEATRYKSDGEMRAEIAECTQPGWFAFGPLPIFAVMAITMSAIQESNLKSCVEGKGYAFGEPPPQPVK